MTPEEYEKLIRELEKENSELKEKLARAKDPEPCKRPTFNHVQQLVKNCCLDLTRKLKNGKTKGFIVSLGKKTRVFKRLKDVFLFVTQAEWTLDELFPPYDPKKPKQPKPKTCQYCNRLVKWHKEWNNEKWGFDFTLQNPDGTRHKCHEYKVFWAKTLSDDLPDPVI